MNLSEHIGHWCVGTPLSDREEELVVVGAMITSSVTNPPYRGTAVALSSSISADAADAAAAAAAAEPADRRPSPGEERVGVEVAKPPTVVESSRSFASFG